MPNTFAYLMLFSWPLVATVMFRVLPLQKALIWTLIGGFLFLPSATQIKLPMLPALDKSLIPAVSALVLCVIMSSRVDPFRDRAGRTGRTFIIGLLGLLVATPLLTTLQNPEAIPIGPTFLPGLRIYDAFSMISSIVVAVIPFYIGLRYLNTQDGHRLLLQAFAVGALVYSLPVLFEVRMSPQLHTWIYGFFPHDFVQHIRAGGYRPVVFLNHGLMVGNFFCLAILSALTLWREGLREGRPASGWFYAAVWLIFALVASKNLGALGISAVLSMFVVFTGKRIQTSFAMVVALVVLLYPMLRGAGHIPVDAVHELATSVDEERAASLKFRLDNEDALLAHANEKPVFGWGNWGRNQLYDDVTGEMISVTDGSWIILIGMYGWIGYIAHFGLLTLPVFFYYLRGKEFGPSLITPGLMLVLSAALIDLIPNAGLVNYVWLMAGGLAGYVLWPSAGTVGKAKAGLPQATGAATVDPAQGLATWVMASAEGAGRKPRSARHGRRD
ncbi:MAG TPA: hypothetical protein PLM52_11895 [Tabrizicola sp.]|nr:hypothetical protein [Tabrizicola sp.]